MKDTIQQDFAINDLITNYEVVFAQIEKIKYDLLSAIDLT